MVDHQNSLINRLSFFLNNLEENLSSFKLLEDKFNEFIVILSKTHEKIFEDLHQIKTILNENNIDEDYDELIQIDGTESEWNNDDEENLSKQISTDKTNHRMNSSLKKSPQSISSTKSTKSVTFHLDRPHSQQQKKIIPIFQQFPKEKSFVSKESKINIEKSSNMIRIHEIESKNGDYLRLLNLSKTDDYDLNEHFLQQNFHSKIVCRFHFPSKTILKAGQTITIWCGRNKNIEDDPPDVFLWKEQRKWQTKPETITILAKSNGQIIASYRNDQRFLTDQSSSDILHVYAKINGNSSDSSNLSHRTLKSNRLSTLNLLGTSKPPFTYSPTHPDFNGTNLSIQHEQRSKAIHKNTFSELLNRPKSSQFSSHTISKQDFIGKHVLQTHRYKQSINQN